MRFNGLRYGFRDALEKTAHGCLCLRIQTVQPEPLRDLIGSPANGVRLYRQSRVHSLFQPLRYTAGQVGKDALKVRLERLRNAVKLEIFDPEIDFPHPFVKFRFQLRLCSVKFFPAVGKLQTQICQADFQRVCIAGSHALHVRGKFRL